VKIHLLGLPHTVTDEAHSHCAFTGKIHRFPAMMQGRGYEIVHYGVEGADTAADQHVEVMTREEQSALRGHDGSDPTRFYGADTDAASPLYREFNRRLRQILIRRVTLYDLVLLPFGWGHHDAVQGLPLTLVESGIGYNDLYAPAKYRIFESYAWMHYHQGKAARQGHAYEWVIPNYFDVDAWDYQPTPRRDTVVFLGRLNADKGLPTLVEVAKHRPDLRFLLCGQGDPTPWLTLPNIEYVPPISGRARSAYLGNARACLMPTAYTEPFGGVAVEAMLCGTPAITTDFGAFSETVEHGRTGFRCHTLGDFLAAIDRAPTLDRASIATRARRLYGYARVGAMYDRAFQQIADLWDEGWYSPRTEGAAPCH
jgi:glycosyltransferase involved in cell wall biosynthesis